MALTKTPVCDFGKKAENFKLKSIKNELVSLDDIKGDKATLVMFICNHCPYVRAIIKDLIKECNDLENEGVSTVAIMSNDTKKYPDDSFDNMIKFSEKNNFAKVQYLFDNTQEIAKKYGAVCTPDFFFYFSNLELQYRGRFKELKDLPSGDSDLKLAMKMIALTNKGPEEQIPSMGCNIKWID